MNETERLIRPEIKMPAWGRKPRTIARKREQTAIRVALDAGDVAGAQRIILARLKKEMEGPRTIARMRNGRKVLKAVAH